MEVCGCFEGKRFFEWRFQNSFGSIERKFLFEPSCSPPPISLIFTTLIDLRKRCISAKGIRMRMQHELGLGSDLVTFFWLFDEVSRSLLLAC